MTYTYHLTLLQHHSTLHSNPLSPSSLSPNPQLFSVALPPGIEEVKRFETSRFVIFNSVRQGFAAAYDSLVLDPALRGQVDTLPPTLFSSFNIYTPDIHPINNSYHRHRSCSAMTC